MTNCGLRPYTTELLLIYHKSPPDGATGIQNAHNLSFVSTTMEELLE